MSRSDRNRRGGLFAVCTSPRSVTHQDGWLKPFRFEMANIREQGRGCTCTSPKKTERQRMQSGSP